MLRDIIKKHNNFDLKDVSVWLQNQLEILQANATQDQRYRVQFAQFQGKQIPNILKVQFKGRQDTSLQGKKVVGYFVMTGKQKMAFYYQNVVHNKVPFLHLNVSNDGWTCHPILEQRNIELRKLFDFLQSFIYGAQIISSTYHKQLCEMHLKQPQKYRKIIDQNRKFCSKWQQ